MNDYDQSTKQLQNRIYELNRHFDTAALRGNSDLMTQISNEISRLRQIVIEKDIMEFHKSQPIHHFELEDYIIKNRQKIRKNT